MRNKRRIAVWLATVACALFGAFALACGGGNADPEIRLDRDSIVISETETLRLNAETENFDGAVEWTSSAPGVARVENGLVTGVAAGNAVVTAKAGEATAECAVRVVASTEMPVIVTDIELVEIQKGGSYPLQASVRFGGAPAETVISYESLNSSIATVDQTGLISGAAYGETSVRLTATYRGKSAEKVVPVKVNYDFDVAMSKSSVSLATGSVFEGTDVGTTNLTLQLSFEQEVQDALTIDWEVGSEAIATVAGSGTTATVTAVAAGDTTVTASFKYEGSPVTCTASVHCFVPEYRREGEVVVDLNSAAEGKVPLTLAQVSGLSSTQADAVYYRGSALDISDVAAGSLKADASAFALGADEIVVESAGTRYRIAVYTATRIISTPEELKTFAVDYKNNQAGELYALGADLDMQGWNLTTHAGSTWTVGNGWKATFDGRGHAIHAIACAHGLFPLMDVGSVVKNLAVLDLQKASNGGGMIANTCNGTIENCFIDGTIAAGVTSGSQAGIAAGLYASGVIRNCVVVVEYTNKPSTGQYTSVVGGVGTAGARVENVVAISETATGAFAVSMTNTQNILAYASLDAFLQDEARDTSAFVAPWTNAQVLPLLPGMDTFASTDFAITTESEILFDGDRVTVNRNGAAFSLKQPVEGVSIANGVVSFETSAQSGTSFTVVASLYGKYTAEKTFRVAKTLDRTNVKFNVDLSKSGIALDVSKLGDSLTAADISSVTAAGSVLPIASKSGNVVTLDAASCAGLGRGDGTLRIKTAGDAFYEVSCFTADRIISAPDDLKAFAVDYVKNKAGGLYVLDADLDMQGWNLTTHTGSTQTVANGWKATFDGRGHAIANVACAHGLFPYIVAGGTVKNLAVYHLQKATNGGGILSNDCFGTVENCFIEGTIAAGTSGSQAGLVHVLRPEGVIRNCAVVFEYTNRPATGHYTSIAGGTSAPDARIENVIAISETATGAFAENMTNTKNIMNYASLEAFLQDEARDTSAFVAPWTNAQALPLLPGVETYAGTGFAITTESEILFDGDRVNVNRNGAAFALKEPVEGISIAGGVVTFAASAQSGTSFTVVASLYGKYTAEKTFRVAISADRTDVKFDIDLSKSSIQLDVSELGDSLTAEDISSVTAAGSAVTIASKSGNVVTLEKASCAGLRRGDGTLRLMTANGDIYDVSCFTADRIIMTKADMEAFAVAYNTTTASTFVVLGADIDMENVNVTTLTGSTMTLAHAWRGTFDGQGHVIRNVAYTHGLFATMQTSGVVRNLGLVDPIKATNGGGLIANECYSGTIENCFIKGTLTAVGHGGIANSGTPIAKNCVLLVENASGVTGGNAVFGSSNGGTGCQNVFVVSASRTKLTKDDAAIGKRFATLAELNADADVAALNGTGYWKVEGGELYFGECKVG